MFQHRYGALSSMEEDPEQEERRLKINESRSFQDTNSKYLSYLNIAGIFIVSIIIFAVVIVKPPAAIKFTMLNDYSSESDSNSLTITISNEYGTVSSDKYPYSFLSDSLFAEVYKSNVFQINEAMSGCYYDYSITGIDDSFYFSQGQSIDGTFSVYLTKPGQYIFSVDEICDSAITRSLSQTLWSKYVRREITELTESDREEFLDAFAVLWKVSTEDGRKIYGEDYKSVYYFAVIHNDAGGGPVCDEFHGDSGFINNHVMLGVYLEKSLQLINPKTSLHYMDYFKYFSFGQFDAHINDQYDGGSWTDVMTSTYFGSNDPFTGKILDGRWAETKVPLLTSDFFKREGINENKLFFNTYDERIGWFDVLQSAHVASPYGLLRSPWNYNPSTYLTRYNNVNRIQDLSVANSDIITYYRGVDCTDYLQFTKHCKKYTMQNMLGKIEDETHGNFHFTVAGAGGDRADVVNKYLKSQYGFDDNDIIVLARISQKLFKQYMTGAIFTADIPIPSEFPIQCKNTPWNTTTQSFITTAYPGEKDGPSCGLDPILTSDELNLNAFIEIMFEDWNISQPEYSTKEKFTNLDYVSRVDAINSYIGRFQFEGDMAGSSAAMDPLFWVAHGALERLYQKLIFSDYLLDTTYAPQGDTVCTGHTINGTKPWLDGYYFNDVTIVAVNVTNAEFLDHLSPNSDFYRDNFNAIYDHSNWKSVCADDGITLFKPKHSSKITDEPGIDFEAEDEE